MRRSRRPRAARRGRSTGVRRQATAAASRRRLELADEHGTVLAVAVVVGNRRRAVQVLGARPLDDAEPHRSMEPHRHSVAGPGDRLHPSDAPPGDVVEEQPIERRSQAVTPPVRVRCDHVDVGSVGIVGADEADEEAEKLAIAVLGDPGRAGEVLEPQPEQEVPHPAATPPLVDERHDRRVIRLRGPAKADRRPIERLAHRDAAAASPPAARSSSGTRKPWTSAKYSIGSRTPPSQRPKSQIPRRPIRTTPTAMRAAHAGGRTSSPISQPMKPAATISPAVTASTPPRTTKPTAPTTTTASTGRSAPKGPRVRVSEAGRRP